MLIYVIVYYSLPLLGRKDISDHNSGLSYYGLPMSSRVILTQDTVVNFIVLYRFGFAAYFLY